MTHKEVFGDARWLCPKEDIDAAIFRAEFDINKAQSAEITVCGLGYFILYINGERVSDNEFAPAYTDYHERTDMRLEYPLNDIRSHRINCLQYDITPFIKDGKNVIEALVGGGFYHQTLRQAEGNMNYGKIKLCYKINLADSSEILSGKDAVYSKGFFVQSNLFYGEKLDFTVFDRNRNELEDEIDGWKAAEIVSAPQSDYYIQDCPPDRVCEILKPELVKKFGEYSVYKIEKNISGYPVIRCGEKGERVICEFAEELDENQKLSFMSTGGNRQIQRFEFVADGKEETYHPYFSWSAFRYFSVTNNAEPVEVRFIHTDIKATSGFECSDETLNWYYKTFINTQLSNMHGSIPSDCPHRERLGYTGDGMLTCDAVMTEFDAEKFYRKWIEDIKDCQDKSTGHVQHTAPFAGGGGGPAGWGGAIIVVPYHFYRHYGDIDALRAVYPNMAKFVEYMQSRTENGLIAKEEKDGWCLGDWCTPEKIAIPEPLVNTTLFIIQLKMLTYLCAVLGEDASKYENFITEYTEALKREYADGDGSFIGGLQGADGFAAECGAGDSKTLENLIEKYTVLGQFDTGIYGTYSLLNVLYESGNGDLATALLMNKKPVSFETMRKAGATTLWENWNGADSHSHPMFGASTRYLFRDILGIKQTENSVRYDEVIIEPCFADCLNFARGYITTPHGEIHVSWKRGDNGISVSVNLCNGVNAVLKREDKIFNLEAGDNKLNF